MIKSKFSEKTVDAMNEKISQFITTNKDAVAEMMAARVIVSQAQFHDSSSLKARAEIYENYLREASIAKTRATDLADLVSPMLDASSLLLKVSENLIRIGEGDALLRDMGFPKLTESLRDSALYAVKCLNDLRENIAALKSMMRTIEKYEWYFKEDESTMKALLESLGNRPML